MKTRGSEVTYDRDIINSPYSTKKKIKIKKNLIKLGMEKEYLTPSVQRMGAKSKQKMGDWGEEKCSCCCTRFPRSLACTFYVRSNYLS